MEEFRSVVLFFWEKLILIYTSSFYLFSNALIIPPASHSRKVDGITEIFPLYL